MNNYNDTCGNKHPYECAYGGFSFVLLPASWSPASPGTGGDPSKTFLTATFKQKDLTIISK